MVFPRFVEICDYFPRDYVKRGATPHCGSEPNQMCVPVAAKVERAKPNVRSCCSQSGAKVVPSQTFGRVLTRLRQWLPELGVFFLISAHLGATLAAASAAPTAAPVVRAGFWCEHAQRRARARSNYAPPDLSHRLPPASVARGTLRHTVRSDVCPSCAMAPRARCIHSSVLAFS